MAQKANLVRAALLAAALLLSLGVVAALQTGITFPLGAVQDAPFSIRLNYSAAVAITNGTLYHEALPRQFSIVRHFNASAFVTTDGGRSFTVAMDDDLDPGNYSLIVSKKEASGPQNALPSDTVTFRFEPFQTGFYITILELNTLYKPNHTAASFKNAGFAETRNYNVTFSTSESGLCRYSTATPTPPPSGMTVIDTIPLETHTIRNLQGEMDAKIWCESSESGVNGTWPVTFGYETAPASFAVVAYPLLVVDARNKVVWMTINNSDQKVACEAKVDGNTFEFGRERNLGFEDLQAYDFTSTAKINFTDFPPAGTNKTIEVWCQNRAGMRSLRSFNITFNLVYPDEIVRVSPGSFTKMKAPLFALQVQKAGQPIYVKECTYTPPPGSPATLTRVAQYNWTATLSNLEEKTYNIPVVCTLENSSQITETLSFTVDFTKPDGYELNVSPYLCIDEAMVATITEKETEEPEENFALFRYEVRLGSNVKENGETSQFTITATMPERQVNKTYKWYVTPEDLAGNIGTQLVKPTTIVKAGSIQCDYAPPTVTVNQKAVANNLIMVQVVCKDDGSGCYKTFNYSRAPSKTLLANCSFGSFSNYTQNITFNEPGALCYMVWDNKGNTVKGVKEIIGAVLPTHCNNTAKDGDETGLNCGGSCPGCKENETCSEDDDCTSNTCNPATGRCGPAATCTDKIKNGFEKGVDCGGSCPGCAAGANCTQNEDCASRFCSGGSCENVSCTNKKKDGYETSVDCGGAMCPRCAVNAGCVANIDCVSGICEQGICIDSFDDGTDTDDDTDPYDEEPGIVEGISALGLTLLILGLLVMGSSGYWLTLLHKHRIEEEAETAHRHQPAMQPEQMTPEQRYALLRQRQAQLEALRQRQEMAKQREAHKSAERKDLIGSFGDEHGEKKPAQPLTSAIPTAKETSDEFVTLDNIGKKRPTFGDDTAAAKVVPAKQGTKFAAPEDTFAKLDKVIASDEKARRSSSDSLAGMGAKKTGKAKPGTKTKNAKVVKR